MYPSGIAPLLRTSSNPDLSGDPITLDVRNVTDKMQKIRKFWAHGIQTAASSLVNIPAQPPTQSDQPSKDPQSEAPEGPS